MMYELEEVRWGRRAERSWSKLDRRIRWVSSRLSNWFKGNAGYVDRPERERKRTKARGRGAGVDRLAVATGVAGSRFKLFACFGFATALCINSTAWGEGEGDRGVRRGRHKERNRGSCTCPGKCPLAVLTESNWPR